MAPDAKAMPSIETNVQPLVLTSDCIIAASVRPARRHVPSAAWLLMSSRSYQRRKPRRRMLEVGSKEGRLHALRLPVCVITRSDHGTAGCIHESHFRRLLF